MKFIFQEVQRIGSEDYLIDKQLGKGRYGTVFKAVDWTGRQVALKYEKPANKWEFYICRELQQRLAQHPMRDRFMDVQIGYFREYLQDNLDEYEFNIRHKFFRVVVMIYFHK